MSLSDIGTAFLLGLATPLTAACVLPLYPAFLVYLSNQTAKAKKHPIFLFGLIISLGVIASMSLLGILFTTILKVSLTTVIGIISPIAFLILAVISILMISNVNVGQFFPKIHTPLTKNPFLSAGIFGFFFGAVVIPCNPLFIAALFARTIAVTDYLLNVLTFFSFGLGISAPLLLFAILSETSSGKIIGFVTKYQRAINIISGGIMLAISLYYLIFTFHIFG